MRSLEYYDMCIVRPALNKNSVSSYLQRQKNHN
jgi:hypothetical protein